MNTGQRQKARAIMRLRTVQPIMATLHDEGAWHRIVFIDPRDWDEAKAVYGDDLQKLF